MEVQQLGSPSVLMPTYRVVEPSPTTRVFNGKALIAEAFLVLVSSSSSEDHNYYLGDEVDFSNEPALSDTSKVLHFSEEEMHVYVPAMVPPLGKITAANGISSIPLNYYPVDFGKYFYISFEFHLQEWLLVLKLRPPPILKRCQETSPAGGP